MTTYALQGIEVEFGDDNSINDFDIATLQIVTNDGVTALDYSYLPFLYEVGLNEVQFDADGEDVSNFQINGNVLDGTESSAVGALSWSLNGENFTTYVALVDIPAGNEFIFVLGGDPLPTITSGADFAAFTSLVGGVSNVPFGDPFGPNQDIDINVIPWVSVTEEDDIIGTSGNDSFDAGAGNDQINGLAGDDILRGGAGDDQLITLGGNTLLDGGDGFDDGIVISSSFTSEMVIDFAGGIAGDLITVTERSGGEFSFDFYTVEMQDIERVVTSFGGDMLIEGSDGRDRIKFDEMVDSFTFNGGGGTDQLDLHRVFIRDENGDEIQRGLTSAEFIEQYDLFDLGGGTTIINFAGTHDTWGTVNGLEDIRLNDGVFGVADLVALDGSVMEPTEGDDMLTGTLGNDVIDGLAGADIINGLAGDDRLTGGLGGDTLNGGDGFDLIFGDSSGLYNIEESGQIFRIFSAVLGREPGTTGHQLWTQQLVTDTLTLREVAEGFMAGPEFQAIYGSTTDTEFVTLLFQNIFGRDPADAGLQAWLTNIENGMSRAEVVERLADGAEHKVLTRVAFEEFEAGQDETAFAPQLYRLFEAIFGREPGEGGYLGWMDNLRGDFTFEEVVSAFMETPEFQLTYGMSTNETFITTLFTNVLGRPPADAGRDAWVANLDGGMSREEVVLNFVNSPEFVNNTEDAMIAFVKGLGGGDTIAAGEGNAVVSGGFYADTFQFESDGQDSTVYVTDLEIWDTLEFQNFGLTQQGILDEMVQIGDDVVFTAGAETVVFAGMDLDDITTDMIQTVDALG